MCTKDEMESQTERDALLRGVAGGGGGRAGGTRVEASRRQAPPRTRVSRNHGHDVAEPREG